MAPGGWRDGFPERFGAAIAAIDRANAADPVVAIREGSAYPKELLHAELMTARVLELDPDAGELQLIAARAHHLRRWVVPRASYPDGRSGYLRWRTALRRQHAEEVGEILGGLGYREDETERVQQIVAKRGLGHDAEVQVHEDALCLVFLETQFAELADRLDHDHLVDVVRKTLAKMSDEGIAVANGIDLPPALRSVLTEASS